ncbi:MAG: hypothetical protein COB84_03940 [Rhodobacteraceae bacterium]|nr:MAG: hypothetical protein COB84_03940 [Paracoccaceae bacterium]
MKKSAITTVSISIIALSGCWNGAYYDGFNATAERSAETNTFGSATANNTAVHAGLLTNEMLANLTRKFASEALATVNFAFNSSRLDAETQAALQRQAAWIKAHPQIVFTVYGHTDKVGGNVFNQNLGKRRARAVANYLTSQGIPRAKLRAVASFGETRPLVLTEERNRQNRRTVTEVSGFGSHKKSGRLDGRYAIEIYDRYITLENQEFIREEGGLVTDTANEGGTK